MTHDPLERIDERAHPPMSWGGEVLLGSGLNAVLALALIATPLLTDARGPAADGVALGMVALLCALLRALSVGLTPRGFSVVVQLCGLTAVALALVLEHGPAARWLQVGLGAGLFALASLSHWASTAAAHGRGRPPRP